MKTKLPYLTLAFFSLSFVLGGCYSSLQIKDVEKIPYYGDNSKYSQWDSNTAEYFDNKDEALGSLTQNPAAVTSYLDSYEGYAEDEEYYDYAPDVPETFYVKDDITEDFWASLLPVEYRSRFYARNLYSAPYNSVITDYFWYGIPTAWDMRYRYEYGPAFYGWYDPYEYAYAYSNFWYDWNYMNYGYYHIPRPYDYNNFFTFGYGYYGRFPGYYNNGFYCGVNVYYSNVNSNYVAGKNRRSHNSRVDHSNNDNPRLNNNSRTASISRTTRDQTYRTSSRASAISRTSSSSRTSRSYNRTASTNRRSNSRAYRSSGRSSGYNSPGVGVSRISRSVDTSSRAFSNSRNNRSSARSTSRVSNNGSRTSSTSYTPTSSSSRSSSIKRSSSSSSSRSSSVRSSSRSSSSRSSGSSSKSRTTRKSRRDN